MVYGIAELRNYRQLARLRAADLPRLEAGLLAALGPRAVPAPFFGQGIWRLELGPEEELDVGAAAQAGCRIRDYLAAHRAELFGFAVLIASLPSENGAEHGPRVRHMLEQAEQDEQLWLAPECAALFGDALTLEAVGSLYRSSPRRRPAPLSDEPREALRPWIRESLVQRALDLLTPRLNEGQTREILWVHGPSGVGKTALLGEMAARLVPSDRGVPILRMRTIFRRRSPLHPFLSSLQPDLVSAVPAHLHGPERIAWKEAGGIIPWLMDASASEGNGHVRPLPDRILDDFGLAYRLYLLAWTRMADEALVPALLLCEGADGFHPAARRVCARLFDDLLMRPSFIPIFSSATESVPDELAALDLRPLYVHPLGKREIRSLADHLFPGLAIPESLSRRLRRRSGGLYVSVVSYMHYLSKTGHIRLTPNGRHEWVQSSDDEVTLPANPLSVSWFLIRTLQDDTFQLLYALYLAGGLLDRQGLLAFLGEAGFDAASAGRTLTGLLVSGLMSDERALIPRFPALRKKLEELLGADGAELRERFVAHMIALWDSGRYAHPVLLFTFLARNGRTDLALRILPAIIDRKLDERDPQSARAFCDPRGLEFTVPPTPEQAREIAAVTALGRLRSALMEGDAEAAEAAQSEAQKWAAGDARPALRGEVGIARATFFLSTGNAGAALEELKRAVLLYQDLREGAATSPMADRGERACYLWLGAVMLAEGRLGESAEYLGLSERLCHEHGDAHGSLRTLVSLAVCLFTDGRLTQCLAVIDQGIQGAQILYRREEELFLLFLRARVLFLVGSHDQCALCLQNCLCVASLYSIDGALPVLRAWLGRTFLHQGNAPAGTRLLESLSEQSREVLFFLAEGCLFSGDMENASLYVERGLSLPAVTRFPSPEIVSWQDGFSGVEGRCFRLSRGDSFLRRSLTALRAYLQGMRGFRDEGIRELHQLTRVEKAVEEDPLVHWFNYLYARVLPESGSDETDDKLTVLGKSLKTLQERASRIDGPSERSSFLWRNRWNRLIMEEARERKLL